MDNNSNSSIHEVTSGWDLTDYLGAIKVRSGIGRYNYKIEPGLYKTGNPDSESDVFVSANYKLSFDILRKNLKGIDAWILVLDTKGINVWCAAGKGTLGTKELILRIMQSNLYKIVSHRRLILPQLSATGVSGFIVKEVTGFNVKFGPVRASDIKQYINAGYKKTEENRQVHFKLKDRIILTPVEIINSLWLLLVVIAVFFGLSGITSTGYSFEDALYQGLKSVFFISTAYLSGAFLTPVLLPWVPFRYFAGKGIAIESIVFVILILSGIAGGKIIYLTGWFLMLIAVSSFLAMNFTGSSTYTSISGVKKEMRLFIPVQLVSVFTGLVLFVVSKFI